MAAEIVRSLPLPTRSPAGIIAHPIPRAGRMLDSTTDRATTQPLTPASDASSSGLVRVMGKWDLTANVINGVIGSGIFGLPAAVAALTGTWSPATVLLGGLCIFPIVLCFAEVGSRFEATGGPYLYARTAF